ncbi:uncharacterized protein BDZ99DRAFT_120619 [Mytilinidion resinicola]|uniref:Uncharacterized protein n=1 Tax=Mytilinidion resinicola TaxID=574789 RepID=A0A6A6Z4K3_9PEZI|nr:uncharacterized protein BDZ99DRAFT_120619 [Mytilinidion resinicola]KAF2815669.1 hypothetical protein BDZ99DRAFT_120619 [Mytilinidion resinicola]
MLRTLHPIQNFLSMLEDFTQWQKHMMYTHSLQIIIEFILSCTPSHPSDSPPALLGRRQNRSKITPNRIPPLTLIPNNPVSPLNNLQHALRPLNHKPHHHRLERLETQPRRPKRRHPHPRSLDRPLHSPHRVVKCHRKLCHIQPQLAC